MPGIGGVWFSRQLSWASAGIELSKELALKPAKVANSIEALACKMEWRKGKDSYEKRGRRAFARDDGGHIWSFNDLSDKTHYVQVTYRQSTVRALSNLKLTVGTRFNTMELTERGHDLAKAFLDQKKIYSALCDWLNGEDIARTQTITEGLASAWPTDEEKTLIRNILSADSSDGRGDPHRRYSIIEAFGRNTVNMPDLDVIKQNLLQSPAGNLQEEVNNIDTSLAFDAMLECGRAVIYTCANLIADKASPSLLKLTQDRNLDKVLDALKKAANNFQQSPGKKHPAALKFMEEILSPSASEAERMKTVIQRDRNILDVSGEKVLEGHLFDRRKESSTDETSTQEKVGTEESSTGTKIRQLFELWRDCQ